MSRHTKAKNGGVKLNKERRGLMSVLPLTMAVPEWGRLVLGIGENASYDAAKRGDIVTINIGDKLKKQMKRVGFGRRAALAY
jgi:hypothetical protein